MEKNSVKIKISLWLLGIKCYVDKSDTSQNCGFAWKLKDFKK